MQLTTTGLLKLALSSLHFTGLDRLLAPLAGGAGVIFMLHRVRPANADGQGPNRILEVTPEFLDEVIRMVLARGYDVVSLDEAHARLGEGDFDRPFACFTFDDGYRDNREHAYPIFRRHRLPFTIYVPTDFPDGEGDLWWLKLEMVLGQLQALDIKIDGTPVHFDLAEADGKDTAFARIYWWLRSIPEVEARHIVAELCAVHGIDVSSLCHNQIMTWGEIRDLAADPLVTIGAHTRRHLALAKLTWAEARLEIEESVRRLEMELGRPIRHFSYPYGDATSAGPREFELVRELGLATAVTTNKGLINTGHAALPTSLPRLSLNGEFQKTRYVKVMLSGVPFALLGLVRRMTRLVRGARFKGDFGSRVAARTSTG